jgi:hypothetical protein
MEGQAVQTSTNLTDNRASERKRDLLLLLLLLVGACALRGALLFRAEVPARDTVGFIRYALQFEQKDWPSVLRGNHQHPGYPLSIYTVSIPVRALSSLPQTETMSLCARLASSLAAVLLVIPMFYLGKLLFHQAAGFGAAALFQCLPVPAHILSDGLSEPLFLLLAATALVFATLALRDRKLIQFVACGSFCSLAYLTRPEGALLLAAALIVLIGLQWTSAQRQNWTRVLGSAAALLGSAVVVGAPYVVATDGISNKPSVNHILNILLRKEAPPLENTGANAPDQYAEVDDDRPRPLAASLFAVNFDLNDSAVVRTLKTIWGIAFELVKSFHYVAWIPALLGAWWYRRRLNVVPGMWVLVVACGMLCLALWRLAASESYLSDRHVLLILMAGCFAAAAAIWELPLRLACLARRQSWPPPPGQVVLSSGVATAAALGILAALLASSMPKTFEPLHSNRAGYHEAGRWLAEHATPWDVVEDDHTWAHYYAGYVFLEGHAPPRPANFTPTRYVVVGRRERDHVATPNQQKDPVNEKKLTEEGGHIVYSWPRQSQPGDAAVVVYAVEPPRH